MGERIYYYLYNICPQKCPQRRPKMCPQRWWKWWRKDVAFPLAAYKTRGKAGYLSKLKPWMTLVWRTWAYFSVIVTLEWASILLTVSIPTPFVKAQVAKVWRL